MQSMWGYWQRKVYSFCKMCTLMLFPMYYQVKSKKNLFRIK